MPIKLNNVDITIIKLGTTNVIEVKLNNTKVWPMGIDGLAISASSIFYNPSALVSGGSSSASGNNRYDQPSLTFLYNKNENLYLRMSYYYAEGKYLDSSESSHYMDQTDLHYKIEVFLVDPIFGQGYWQTLSGFNSITPPANITLPFLTQNTSMVRITFNNLYVIPQTAVAVSWLDYYLTAGSVGKLE